MRLILKLTLVLSLVMACALAVQAILHVQRVRSLHLDETRDDLTILARALSSAAGELWTVQGERRAREYIAKADARRSRTRIQLVGANVGPSRLGVDPSIPEVRDQSLVTYANVMVGGAPAARLELTRTRHAEREFTRDVIWSQIVTVAAAVGASGVLALVLGFWLVGRPVERLIEHARRVARGDFSVLELPGARDELGNLALEMVAMTGHLAEAEQRARDERRQRAQAFEQLRHADRLSTVGKIASGIAHELGTPLNVVSGRAALISSSPEATDKIRANAETIAAQSEHMTQILRQLLDFSRRRRLERGDARPREILEEAAMLVEPLSDEHDVRVRVAAADDIEVNLDRGKTLQVITNLLVNAIQAMPSGGVAELAASVQTVDRPPDRRAAPGRFVCFSVRDEGTGISTADLERIFEPFFTTKEEGEGTGLGLSVSHGIVREHGGWIEADSEPGQGSCFRVYLPAGGAT